MAKTEPVLGQCCTTMWGTNCECSIAQKTHGLETPVLCAEVNDLPQHQMTWGSPWFFAPMLQPVCGALWTTMWGSKLAEWPCSLCAKKSWLDCGKSFLHTMTAAQRGLTMCFLRHCCTHSLWGTLWSAMPQNTRSWPCSLCAEVMIYHSGKSLLHTKHGQDRASFGHCDHSVGHKLWCSIAAKNTLAETPAFVQNNDLPQSNHDFCTQNCMVQDRASFAACAPHVGHKL